MNLNAHAQLPNFPRLDPLSFQVSHRAPLVTLPPRTTPSNTRVPDPPNPHLRARTHKVSRADRVGSAFSCGFGALAAARRVGR